MTRILMAGTGREGVENFAKTVLGLVDLEECAGILTSTEWRLLEAKHGRLARVWGLPARNGAPVTSLRPGDQTWFHRDNYVRHVAEVVTVFWNVRFEQALWADSGYVGSGFIFTVTEPQNAQISKAGINELLGHKPHDRWQQNRLLDEEDSKLLASQVCLVLGTGPR